MIGCHNPKIVPPAPKDSLRGGVISRDDGPRRDRGMTHVYTTITANPRVTLPIAAVVLAAGLCCGAPASRASYGDAPWCLIKSGGEDTSMDCEFKTFADCARARTGVNFCNVNPSGPPAAPAPAPRGRR
jgi:hypothetical protein